MSDNGATVIIPRARVAVGTTLNGIYRIDHPIAAGGMGEIYKGYAIQTGDAVAIKMIRSDLAESESALALFRKEASSLHNLQHEAIVRYYLFSIDPQLGRAYLAMEFVDGTSLKDHLVRGPLSVEDTMILQQRIASGLHSAHKMGIIHRDVAPDNVILPGADVAAAKILDFGIARSTKAGEQTIIGSGFAGKYNYVSPEQLGLFGGDVTPKSDIYSFGLVLAECLLGRPIDMGGSQVDVIDKRRVVPDLSKIDPRFRPLLEKMLQPLPEKRPETMADVAAWQPAAGKPARAAGSPGGAKTGMLVAAGLGAVAVLGGGLYFGLGMTKGGSEATPIASLDQSRLANEEAQAAEAGRRAVEETRARQAQERAAQEKAAQEKLVQDAQNREREAQARQEREAQARAAEEARRVAEARRQEDETRKVAQARAEEEARTLAERRATEEAKRIADAKATEEARRLAEARTTEENRKQAEARAADEARKLAEAKAAEDARKLSEARTADDARRLAAEAKAAEDARKLAEAKAEEEARKQAQVAKLAEERRLAAEAKATEEARKQAEAKAAEDARRIAAAKAADERRIAAEAKAAEDARKIAEAKAAEEARKTAVAKAAEERRLAAEAKATEDARKLAEAKAAEETRKAAAAEERRLAAEAKAAEDSRKIAEARAADEARKQVALQAEQAQRDAEAQRARAAADEEAARQAATRADQEAKQKIEAATAETRRNGEDAQLTERQRIALEQAQARWLSEEAEAMRRAGVTPLRTTQGESQENRPETTAEPPAQIASVDPRLLAPVAPRAPARPIPTDPKALTQETQQELTRIGCYAGNINGNFNNGTREALKTYRNLSGLPIETIAISPEQLLDLRERPGDTCSSKAAPAKPAAPAIVRRPQREEPVRRAQQPTPRREAESRPARAAPAPAPAAAAPRRVTPGLGLGF